MKKTYKVKNYKGNLVESLKKFSDSHKDIKILEAVEEDNTLKIKAEESEKINEADVNRVFVLIPDADQIQMPIAIFSSLYEAEKTAKEHLKEHNGKISIWYYDLDKYMDSRDHVRLAKTIR